MKRVSGILDILDKLVGFLIVILLAGIWVGLFYQVVMRYVFNRPPVWTEELCMSMMIWVTFLGIGYGVRHRMHIRMNSIIKNFPRKVQQVVALALNIVIAVVVVMLIPYAWEYFIQRSGVISTTMKVSLGIVYVCVPIGYVYLLLNLVVDSIRVIKGDIPE